MSAGLKSYIALRKAKIVYNFGLSECNRIKYWDGCALDSGTDYKTKMTENTKGHLFMQD